MSEPLWHDAFYRFVPIEDPAGLVKMLDPLCRVAGLHGSLLVASEGINGMIAGTAGALAELRIFLGADPRFSDMSYKRTTCREMPFKRLKIKVKRELVPLGVPGVDAAATGPRLDPLAWRALLDREDAVLIDNRNSFEYRQGHFRGAIDPGVENFSEFAAWAGTRLDAWRGRPVAIYCTGGIRCEKASAWLTNLGLEVFQLEGGILSYFAALPDAECDFEGKCFVFDERVALGPDLRETGSDRNVQNAERD